MLFYKSPFSLTVISKTGTSILHWHCLMDSIFMVKIFFRLNNDFKIKDQAGKTPFERASENNGVQVIHFLDGYSFYPFMTNYFLKNLPIA